MEILLKIMMNLVSPIAVAVLAYLIKRRLERWLLDREKKANEEIRDVMQPFIDKQDELIKGQAQITAYVRQVDKEQTKNYLVRTIADIERGQVSESELLRFWEQYGHYTDEDGINGDGYIKRKVENLQKQGLL